MCWVYEHPTEFLERALDYLAAGLAAGQRIELVAPDPHEELRAQAAPLGDVDELLASGRLTIRSLGHAYGAQVAVDPSAPVAVYAAATAQALADGYTGLRVAADATALVRTPAQREAFGRYEHLVDRLMVDQPFSAMCAYDRSALGAQAAAEIACLHPMVNAGAAPFHWFAGWQSDIEVAGEVDLAGRDVFTAALSRTLPVHRGRSVVVDATELSFIDHRGMLILEEQATRAGATVGLITGTPVVSRLAELLDLTAVRVRWTR